MECNFCKKVLSTKSALNLHQKTTKACLKMQGTDKIQGNFVCEYCDKCFTTNNALKKHVDVCKEDKNIIHFNKLKKEFQLLKNKHEDLEKEKESSINDYSELEKKYKYLEKEYKNIKRKNRDLEKEIEVLLSQNMNLQREKDDHVEKLYTLASKPTTVTKNTVKNINNLMVMDWKPETIKEKVAIGFTKEHLEDGLRGVARFTNEHIIKDEKGNKNFICTDPARKIFKYKDINGVIQKDVRAIKLKDAIKEPIIEKSQEIYTSESSRLLDSFRGSANDNLAGDQLSNLTDNFAQIKYIDNNVDIYAKELGSITC